MKTFAKILSYLALLGWLLLVFGALYIWFAPVTWWIDDSSYISVDTPTVAGQQPKIEISIGYQRNLFIHWNKLLFKARSPDQENDWTTVCQLEGEGRFYPLNSPVMTTLDELFPNQVCSKTLSPGQYSIEYDLEIHDNLIIRDAFIESNIFEIVAPPKRATTTIQPVVPKDSSERTTRHYRYHNPQNLVPPFLRWLFKKS